MELVGASLGERSSCIFFGSANKADTPCISAVLRMRPFVSANSSSFSSFRSNCCSASAVLRCSSSNRGAVLSFREHPTAFANSHRKAEGSYKVRASEEDSSPIDDSIDDSFEFALDYLDNAADAISETQSEAVSAADALALARREATKLVDYKIDEEKFHKICLYQCDFFIRKAPDKDNDLYDFREMYVTPTDTDIYSRPTIIGHMPTKLMRCTKSSWESIYVAELPLGEPRSPYYTSEERALKVFLIKHYKNRRATAKNFVLNFEQIYIINAKSKSISRAKVTVSVPEGKNRDRQKDALLVRDGGTSFRVIESDKKKTPDEVIGNIYWKDTRETMQNFLRGFRDYQESNWF